MDKELIEDIAELTAELTGPIGGITAGCPPVSGSPVAGWYPLTHAVTAESTARSLFSTLVIPIP